MAKNDTIQLAVKNKSALSRLLNRDDNDLIVDDPRCKFCQSKHRTEMEQMYEDKMNIRMIATEMENKGEKVSYPAVRNHLLFHYIPQQKRLRVREYAKNLSGFLQEDKDRRSQIAERISMLTDMLYDIASQIQSMPFDDKLKGASQMKTISDSLTLLEDKVEEMDGRMKPVEALIATIQSRFQEKMKTTTDEVRSALLELLDSLQNDTKNLLVEKESE